MCIKHCHFTLLPIIKITFLKITFLKISKKFEIKKTVLVQEALQCVCPLWLGTPL